MKIGRWTIIKEVDRHPKYKHRRFLCKCDCGTERVVLSDCLRSGRSTSCGCYNREVITKHGMKNTSTYRSWDRMIQRCTNPNKDSYYRYGGRGIKVCDRWLKFENFYADMGERPEGMTLDRIDSNGNYCKENCRWANNETQMNNRCCTHYIEYDNQKMSLAQFARYIDIKNPRAIYSYANHLTPVQIAQKYGKRNIVNG